MAKFRESVWLNAATLSERAALLATIKDADQKHLDRSNSEEHLQKWRTQYPLNSDEAFGRFLKNYGISRDDFLHLLNLDIDALTELFPPPQWFAKFEEAYAGSEAVEPYQSKAKLVEADNSLFGFLEVIEPIINLGLDRIHKDAQDLANTYPNAPFDLENVGDFLTLNIFSMLIGIIGRTFTLEMNVARLKEVLEGANSEERFRDFVRQLRKPEAALLMFEEYPVLARQIELVVDNWAVFSLEFLQHLCEDWEEICDTFVPVGSNPGVLTKLIRNDGDKHHGGKSVLILEFDSGFRIVYKPRSLAVDNNFQKLLLWLNEHNIDLLYKPLKMLVHDTHGWIEFVDSDTCNTEEEIHRFYKRQGGYLALLHVLGGTDIHFSNLIAAGEHPILIDLETLFLPMRKRAERVQIASTTFAQMSSSILNVGLLPSRSSKDPHSDGVDLSALGATEGQVYPKPLPYWEDVGTDEMRLARKKGIIQGASNRPSFNDADVELLDYTEDIVAGFSQVYSILMDKREELLSDNSPLGWFTGDEIRVVLCPTRIYFSLLYESFHPDMLRDALDRERLFNLQWAYNLDPIRDGVIIAEIHDLLQCDIPMFTTYTDSCDIRTSSGEWIKDFFAESGIDVVRRRIHDLSTSDLERQMWFIKAALVTSFSEIHSDTKKTVRKHTPKRANAMKNDAVAIACKIGDRLQTLATRENDEVSWIGVQLSQNERWCLNATGLDFYSGLPGIAFFLAHLGAITDHTPYTELAQQTLDTVLKYIENPANVATIGAHSGWGGIIYTLTHLSRLWNRPDLVEKAQIGLHQILTLVNQDESYDIISGAAGCIGGLLSLYRIAPADDILEIAVQCSEHLINHAQPQTLGVGWTHQGSSTPPLAGLSHGVAGIAWALLKLYEITLQKPLLNTALAALAYERSLFSPNTGNWRDLRDASENYMAAWCHGAPGIGLARLHTLEVVNDDEIHQEINTAIQTTILAGIGDNHSLCHGSLGNMDLLLEANKFLKTKQYWREHLTSFETRVIKEINDFGWRCGLQIDLETPGMMVGIAGIGYGLLRLVDPVRIPCVLILEPPTNDPM